MSGILIAVIAAYLLLMRYYPIALVGDSLISGSEFKKSYSISYNYYLNGLKTANQDTVVLESDEIRKELKRATLDMLVEREIIDRELSKMIEADSLSLMIGDKISKIDFNSDNFKKGTDLLYGASVEDIKNLVLIPRAKEEILEGRLILENEDVAGWFRQKRLEAKVSILTPGFYWSDGEVAAK